MGGRGGLKRGRVGVTPGPGAGAPVLCWGSRGRFGLHARRNGRAQARPCPCPPLAADPCGHAPFAPACTRALYPPQGPASMPAGLAPPDNPPRAPHFPPPPIPAAGPTSRPRRPTRAFLGRPVRRTRNHHALPPAPSARAALAAGQPPLHGEEMESRQPKRRAGVPMLAVHVLARASWGGGAPRLPGDPGDPRVFGQIFVHGRPSRAAAVIH